MKRTKLIAWTLILSTGLSAPLAFAGQSDYREFEEVEIAVAPQTFILSVDEGEWVTVHTNLLYGDVESASVELNGVPLVYAKSDNRGYFVAKLARGDVEDTVEPPRAIVELTGWTRRGIEFYGSDVIRVMD